MYQKFAKNVLLIAVLLLIAMPATAVVPPGRITVYSTPAGANVCVDTKYCDIAPATFVVDGNAWHMVVVTEKGYRDWTETLYVTSDQNGVVSAYLDQDPAATGILVNVTPGGGSICLDNSQCRAGVGTVNDTASTLYTGVSPGYHTISVDSPKGYLDTMKLVQVNLGKITSVNITLDKVVTTPTPTPAPVPATGMVRVYVDRTGSTICIDNAHCVYNVGGKPGPGTGTTVFNAVTVNQTHIVTVAAEGYEPFSATVSVEKDLISKVDVTLQPIVGVTTVLTTVPATVATTVLTTGTQPATVTATTTVPPTMPTAQSPLDAVPVLGALALCGTFALFRSNRR